MVRAASRRRVRVVVRVRAMNWFRLRQRCCGFVALLALAIQLTLSFGHVHGLPTGGPSAVATIAGAADTPQPAGGDQHDDDYCAICAVLAMLSGAQTATAPALPVLVAIASDEIPFAIETAPTAVTWIAFRSRAPPIS
jgi:hypothetical protein